MAIFSTAPRMDQSALAFASRFLALLRALHLYVPGHSGRVSAQDGFVRAATRLVTAAGPLEVRFRQDGVEAGGQPVRAPQDLRASLARARLWLEERGIDGMHILGPPSAADAAAFVAVLETAPSPVTVGAVEALNAALLKQGVRNLRFTGLTAAAARPAAPVPTPTPYRVEDPASISLRFYLRGLRAVQQLQRAGVTSPVAGELTRVVQGFISTVSPEQIRALVVPRDAFPYAARHPVHMALLAIGLGRRLGLSRALLLDLGLTALAVDAGLSLIPAEIREKVGTLSPAERAVLETHPLASVRTLLAAPALTPALRRRTLVAFEHHMGYDRSGYPRPLSWGPLHVYSRIVALVDAFDALAATTSWRQGLAPAEAVKVLLGEAGGRHDPVLVGELAALLGVKMEEVQHG